MIAMKHGEMAMISKPMTAISTALILLLHTLASPQDQDQHLLHQFLMDGTAVEETLALLMAVGKSAVTVTTMDMSILAMMVTFLAEMVAIQIAS
jgi:hypothetical protein